MFSHNIPNFAKLTSKTLLALAVVLAGISLTACSSSSGEKPAPTESVSSDSELSAEERKAQHMATFNEAGSKWLYGPGLGRTIINVGTAVVFPPYALYLLGNAGLELAGYERVAVTDALPEKPQENIDGTYDDIAKVPGRVVALVAGREYYQDK